MKNIIKINYQDIISVKNLYEAWQEFSPGKKNKKDVAEFALNLSQNIFNLHFDLTNNFYAHGGYQAFNIADPKPRNIHKASVRDRLLHHAIHRVLYPLGNLTSQLLVNIYMNKFDQFIKHRPKVKYYIRYADDFVILSEDKDYLWELVPKIADFLEEELKLQLHPNKLFIKTLSSGVDFLGWVHFPNHRVLRTATKRKMFRNLKIKEGNENTVASYLGMLKWGNGYKLQKQILYLL